MAGVYNLEIKESEAELKQLLRAQRTAQSKFMVQLLYPAQNGSSKKDTCGSATVMSPPKSRCNNGYAATVKGAERAWGKQKCPQVAAAGRFRHGQSKPEQSDCSQRRVLTAMVRCTRWLNQLLLQAPDKTLDKLVPYRLESSRRIAASCEH